MQHVLKFLLFSTDLPTQKYVCIYIHNFACSRNASYFWRTNYWLLILRIAVCVDEILRGLVCLLVLWLFWTDLRLDMKSELLRLNTTDGFALITELPLRCCFVARVKGILSSLTSRCVLSKSSTLSTLVPWCLQCRLTNVFEVSLSTPLHPEFLS